MKLNFISFLLLISLNVFSQDSNTYKLPELVLPSPQAEGFSKYGNVEFDESTGNISHSVNLHNYKAGQLILPINLTYSGGGVKVIENPSWTGNSWNLSAGGVITRTVKDLPDETNHLSRKLYSAYEMESSKIYTPLGFDVSAQISNDLLNHENLDTQADEFNFSIPGHSGSFFLKQDQNGNFEAILTKKESELRIEIIGNFSLGDNYEFVITTTDGTKYFLGGLTAFLGSTEVAYAVEETRLVDRSISPPLFGNRAKTAFYLIKIENIVGDKIYFEYHTKDEYNQLSIRDKKQHKLIGALGPNINSSITPEPFQNFDLNDHPIKNIVFNGKFLKRIWSPQAPIQIIFNSIEVNELSQNGSIEFKYRILKDINLGFKNIDLKYFPDEEVLINGTKDKFFLTEIIFKDATNNLENNKYKFEYKNPNLVPRLFSNSQDYLGFYNGKNNPNLLPKNTSKRLLEYFQELGINLEDPKTERILNASNFEGSSLADREPYFEHATNGILTKIVHPTGGFTTFEYEPATKKEITEVKGMQIYSNMGSIAPYPLVNSVYKSYTGISSTFVNEDGTFEENVFKQQTVFINLYINTQSASGLDYHNYIYVKMTNVGTNVVKEKRYYFPSTVTSVDNVQTSFQTTLPFSLAKGHGYTFEMGFGSQSGSNDVKINSQNTQMFSSTPMEVSTSFTYVTGLNPNDGLGIRIKRTEDYPSINEDPIVKRYYYKSIKDLYNEDPVESNIDIYKPLFFNFDYTYGEHIDYYFSSISNVYPAYSYFLILNSNVINNGLPTNRNNSIYKNISISYGGDDFENGGVEKQFHIVKNKEQQHYYPWGGSFPDNHYGGVRNEYHYFVYKFLELNQNANANNNAISNGLLLKESVWKKNNNLLFKFKQTKNEYNFTEYNFIDDLEIKNLFPTYSLSNISIYDLYIGTSKTIAYKPFLIKSITEDFIEEVPLSAYNVNYHPVAWQFGDHNGDGIRNDQDPYFEEWANRNIENDYKKIVNTTEYEYLTSLAGLPSSVISTNSINEVNITKNYYATNYFINQLTDLSLSDRPSYLRLKDENRIGVPIQIETYKNYIKLGSSRFIYKDFNELAPLSLHKVQSAKELKPFEDRVVYHKYDVNGNPTEISLADGTKVIYIWNLQRNPVYKIINATYSEVLIAMNGGLNPIEFDENNPPVFYTNPFTTSLPNAQVTVYNYSPQAQLIQSIIDPKGDRINYEYDEFQRLKFIKDKNGNILQENKINYRPN